MIIVFCGPSAVGKSFAVNSLVQNYGLVTCTPYTTRAPRAGEVQNVDYHFIDLATFKRMIEQGTMSFFDYTLENFYGYDNHLACLYKKYTVAIHATTSIAFSIKHKYPNYTKLVFLSLNDEKEIHNRLIQRGADEASIKTRFEFSKSEMSKANDFDYIFDCTNGVDISHIYKELIND